ncbi:DUF4389 domain-containing protein [Pseudarthrobacter sp. P1]|uniref:DUF4389 domain-containing protein n=1 Tax=Pseudarthrobacter sp. P1 TaxID=3418418 RepID=UPI003CEC1048
MSASVPFETPAKAGPPAGRMPAAQMFLLIAGVLVGTGSLGALGTSLPLPWAPAGMALGAAMILLGAVGLGRAITPGAPLESDRTGDPSSMPAQLTGQLDPVLSRWKWLVKWFLAIPHYAVLAVLWVAFLVVTVAAGVAILVTGRYPAALFQFAVGVLRWNWRVSFYAYGVLGTDEYPPFTLARTAYPAEFDVAYPASLSHWKVLVKSWLLALPQLLVVSALSGGAWASSSASGISLMGVLVLVAAVILLCTGVYRVGLFNLLMGINRWVLRTVTYVALLTDTYPPFRLDQGPFDPPAGALEPGSA